MRCGIVCAVGAMCGEHVLTVSAISMGLRKCARNSEDLIDVAAKLTAS